MSQISAKWNADVKRREIRERDYEYYNDNHNFSVKDGYTIVEKDDSGTSKPTITAGTFLEDIIYRRVNFQEAYILAQYIETDPMTSKTIYDKCLLFKESPAITIPDASEEQQKNFDQMLEDTQFNSLLREIQRLVELHFDVHVIPQVRDNKLVIDIILSQNAFVEQDPNDPAKFEKFFYEIGISENTMKSEPVDKYIYWDSTGQYECEINEGEPDNVEKIKSVWDGTGKTPITVFRNYIPINTYWSTRMNAIVETNIQIDLRLTSLNMLEDFNLPQKVRTGMDAETEGKVGLTFTEDVLRNDQGETVGDVKYIRPDAPVDKEKDLIEWRKQNIAVNNGLSAESLTGKTFTSGFELFLSKSQIIEKNKEERPYYLKPIKELLTNMMYISSKQLDKRFGESLDKMPEVKVNFGELVYTQSPEEKERTRAARLVNGTGSLVEFVMEEDPDIDEKEAIKLIEKRQKWKKLTAPTNPFENEEDPNEGK